MWRTVDEGQWIWMRMRNEGQQIWMTGKEGRTAD